MFSQQLKLCYNLYVKKFLERGTSMFKKKLVEQPLNYWEEKSYMMVIPKDQEEDLITPCFDRISSIKGIKLIESNYAVEGYVSAKIKYEKEEYTIGFYKGGVHVPEYYLQKNFLFKEEERKLLLEAKTALTIFMEFKKDAKKCYHLQLKLALAMVPDLIGIIDESAEKLLPQKWVILAANSNVLPSANDLFTVQAVSSKDGEVWLHTHGLCRANITELEVLESDQKNYQNHYNMLCVYASFLIDKKGAFDPYKESAFIGRLANDYPLVVTCRPWVEALKEYKHLRLGNEKDRRNGHNTKTSPVFVYKSEADENAGILSKISIYDDILGDNPLYFFSDEETERMKELAIERFSYVKKAFVDKDNHILVKIGLPLAQKGKYEHIWFELLDIKKDKFEAKLTQEPYDIKDIHTGYTAWFEPRDITDWIIYTPKFAVNPSTAYLLED